MAAELLSTNDKSAKTAEGTEAAGLVLKNYTDTRYNEIIDALQEFSKTDNAKDIPSKAGGIMTKFEEAFGAPITWDANAV
jgi:hypothetical protein